MITELYYDIICVLYMIYIYGWYLFISGLVIVKPRETRLIRIAINQPVQWDGLQLMTMLREARCEIWLVVWNMFFFHNIWDNMDNPSHWLTFIFFKMVIAPPTRKWWCCSGFGAKDTSLLSRGGPRTPKLSSKILFEWRNRWWWVLHQVWEAPLHNRLLFSGW